MKIAIDASHIDRDGAGIGYVIKGIIAGMTSFPEHEYFIYIRADREFDLPKNFTVIKIPSRSKLLGGGYAWYYNLARELNHRGADVLISPTLNSASQFFLNTLQIVHDLTPITDGQFYGWAHRAQFRMMLGNIVSRARWIVAISQSTKDALIENYPDLKKEIAVVPLGLNSWAQTLKDLEKNELVAKKFDLPEKYLLSVGTVQPRKNYENIIKGFAKFAKDHDDYQYLIVGRQGWMTKKIGQAIKDNDLEDKVRFLGYVPEEELPYVYDQSRAFVNVSFAEGFGLPVLEATTRNLSILTSNLAVYREIVDETRAVFVDPTSPDSIAKGMEEVIKLETPSVEEEFFTKYAWENTARILLEHIQKNQGV